MNVSISCAVDWTPEVLPFAPRPVNGELLSSWARPLAAANGVVERMDWKDGHRINLIGLDGCSG